MAAVSQYGWALEFASEELQSDHEIVMAAVSQYGVALKHASEELQSDHEIVLAAVSQNGSALLDASRGDYNLIMGSSWQLCHRVGRLCGLPPRI